MNSELLQIPANTPIPVWGGGRPMSILKTDATAGSFIMRLIGRAATPPNQKMVDVPIAWNDTTFNIRSKILAATASIGVEGNVDVYGTTVNSDLPLIFVWSAPLDIQIDKASLVSGGASFGHSNIDFSGRASVYLYGSADFYVGGRFVTEFNGLPIDGGVAINRPPQPIDCANGRSLFALKAAAFNVRVLAPNYPVLFPFE